MVEHKIYLTHTHDGTSIENYDCVIVDWIPYCRRPDEPISLTRTHHPSSCENNGAITYTFPDLLAENITASTILHQWKSSIEQVERYSRYLVNPSHNIDGFLCQCNQSQSFGKFCEYDLPAGNTLEETLRWQLKMRKDNPESVQIHGNITCYRGIECDSGLLCLDWREICDGVQNCMYGLDEEQCDLLELNICNDNEYRCVNGMCIPAEYFLDGDFDCLDWSDEMNIKNSVECADESASMQCDDHMCLVNEWSCGDGQCILDRFQFYEPWRSIACTNRRDKYFWCETSICAGEWTMSHGRCSDHFQCTDLDTIDRTDEERCEFLLKCALSFGESLHCPCYSRSVWSELAKNCSSPTIRYPRAAFPAPYIYLFFNRTRSSKRPDFILINGSLKCQGTLINVTKSISFADFYNFQQITDDFFCRQKNSTTQLGKDQPHHQCINSNQSTNICNHWNPCMSITRIRDGTRDCLNGLDEIDQTCSHNRSHRFRCSTDQPTCLPAMALGNAWPQCSNQFDELWQGFSRKLSEINCNSRKKDECSLLRQYIDQSWSSTQGQHASLQLRIPFRSYCDTFIDLGSGQDENLVKCRQSWVCATNQWQCHSHQCIDLAWVNDDEWDCGDASDEVDRFSNLRSEMREQLSRNQTREQPPITWNSCDPDASFVCLSPDLTHLSLKCLNLSQLGDDKVDCLGAIDERNTLKHPADPSSPLGHNFLCSSNNVTIPYHSHCLYGERCHNRNDDQHWCRWYNTSSRCSTSFDFICFDGRCIINARCNGNPQCTFGEDEYMCDYASRAAKKTLPYRKVKENQMKIINPHLRLPTLPNQTNLTQEISYKPIGLSSSIETFINPSPLTSLAPYSCNRGIAVLSNSNHSIICFCPPQYYGNFCQYHADRLSILLHLNLSQSIYTPQSDVAIVIKLLVLLLFHDQVLTIHEFHVRPAFEIFTFNKKMVHFLYSRSSDFRRHRMQRYFNRSNVIHAQPYSIRIEAYQRLDGMTSPKIIAVWQYPITFDYLPVYRFSKALHLASSRPDPDPCSSHPCPRNALCQPLINDPTRYLCLCKSNYTGKDCSIEDQQCAQGYCAPQALCQPNYRQLLRGNAAPYCICPFNRIGDRCDIVFDYCQIQPCQNNGSCFPTSSPDKVACICTKYYTGSHCQDRKSSVRLSLHSRQHYEGVVVQYFALDFTTLDLTLVHQEIYRGFPASIEYLHKQDKIPEIIIGKFYRSHEESSLDLHILAINTNTPFVDGTSEISDFNRCAHVNAISNGKYLSRVNLRRCLMVRSVLVSSPIEYHRICNESETLLCFRDDVYVCVCEDDHRRAECFRYDYELDQCSQCLSGGQCLRGDRSKTSDFICLCPPCHSGHRCQFSSKSFSFTMDQLLYRDLLGTKKEGTIVIHILLSSIGFLFGVANNLFSFVTFKREQSLRNGVGHYLFCLSIANQISLGAWFIRVVHLVANAVDMSISSLLDDVFCRFFSYSFTCSSRLVYWLSSLIAMERVYMTVVLNGQWLKAPRIARRLIALIILIVLTSDVYELMFYRAFFDEEVSRRSICTYEFPTKHQSLWSFLHPFITITNSLLPFLINLCSMVTISFIVIQKKMNAVRKNTPDSSNEITGRRRLRLALDVLTEKKELVIGPAITLIPQLFALPLYVIALALNCENIENSQFRYILIASYYAALTPQCISFFLYITPSSFYSNEWRQTNVAQWIYTKFGWQTEKKTKTTMTIFSKTHQTNKDKF